VHILVWYEMHNDVNAAIAREKQLKGWNRVWKIRLIEKNNSGWNDLYARLRGEPCCRIFCLLARELHPGRAVRKTSTPLVIPGEPRL
jgi:hypothetical protein